MTVEKTLHTMNLVLQRHDQENNMSSTNDKDPLGTRMKGYEVASRTVLPRRMPLIIRVDGKAFHTYTASLKSFDEPMDAVMVHTAKALSHHVQGAVFAYTFSDEISLLVHNYKKFTSQPWYDNQVQKIVSVAAAVASAEFTAASGRVWSNVIKPAYFDARAFVLPEAEACNYFVWRQQDAMRNSVQTFARTHFSHKQCENKSCAELRDMCVLRVGEAWDDLDVWKKRGRGVIAGIADDVPVFSEQRSFINDLLVTEE